MQQHILSTIISNHIPRQDTERGFGLMEISIVLVILGIIIGMLFYVGTRMQQEAGLTSIVADMEHYNELARQFEEIYGGMPGDLANITTYFSSEAATSNGNGNGKIDTQTEADNFWRHLWLAGMVDSATAPEGALPGTTITIQVQP